MFGYERKQRLWEISEGRQLICEYNENHFYFLLRWIDKKKWRIQGDRRSEDIEISDSEVAKYFENGLPKISAYTPIMKWLTIAVIVLFIIITIDGILTAGK